MKIQRKDKNRRVFNRKHFSGGDGLMGVVKYFTPPNSPPPPGPGLMGEGTTGVTPLFSVIKCIQRHALP